MALSEYKNRQKATSDANPILEDGETYTGVFVGFSKPFESPGWQGAPPVWKTVLLYELDNVGRYKEFLKVSTYDGAAGRDGKRYKCARLFLRLQSLVGVKTSAEADRLDLAQIARIPVKVTAAKDEFGKVVIASVRRQQPLSTPAARPQTQGPRHVSAIPGAQAPPATLDDVRMAFLGTGRSEASFDAFLTVYGGPGQNTQPASCQALLRAISTLPKIPPQPPTLEAKAEQAGLDLLPEEPGNYADDLP